MISIQAKVNLNDFRRFLRRYRTVHRLMRSDSLKLARACYKHLKTIIPKSRFSRPHLRNSFKVKASATGAPIGAGILVGLYTNIPYASFVDQGAMIPMRYPKAKKAMKFRPKYGRQDVFTKFAQGFRLTGVHFVDKGEAFFVTNADKYIDLTLRKYLVR